MIHLLDMYGADLNLRVGHNRLSPLMVAVQRWNVRVVDYLMERGVNPELTDKYGFTAEANAKIRNLQTIQSMLENYKTKYNSG
mmetsp:Transcript_41806/g.63873  ORF Transcript_41806/g.63873 Transcript_41806/m.63873 type:complete len:83 (-) Transcript_41806:408-656(-)